MRFLAFETLGKTGLAVVDGDRAVDLEKVNPNFPTSLNELLARHDVSLRDVEAAVSGYSGPTIPVGDLKPALPISDPGKFLCLGLNYVDHAKEGGYDVPDYPAIFVRSKTSMVAAGAPVIRPECSERLDYEAELLVIIGKSGRHISKADALDHIFGYTLFNDVSVRDYQRKTHQWTPGKNFDGTGPVGPIVVTPDELPAGAKGLRIQSILNGQIMQDADTNDMIFPVDETIATISEFTTLEAGDLIAMGTPPGVGHARRPPVWMKDGDEIEIVIEGIGSLKNPVVDEEKNRLGVAAE